MRLTNLTLLLLLIIAFSSTGCGGAGKKPATTVDTDDAAIEEESKLGEEDLIPRAVMVKAELTTEVDQKRYRATGDILTEFEPTEPVIYLVSTLKNVPTQATIEVRWFRDASPDPILVSSISGSERFSFIADLSPARKKFVPGPHTARIFVDDREVGGAPFTILGNDPFTSGPRLRKLAFSTKVTKKMNPKNQSRKFEIGTKKIFATFRVANAAPGTEVQVKWKRNKKTFSEQFLQVTPKGRFGANIESPSGLPAGKYTVVLKIDGEVKIKKRFFVGEETDGPVVDKVALGLALGGNNLPTDEMTEFKVGHSSIKCGLRFLDVPPDSIITIQWNSVEEEEESTWHTIQTAVPGGGSGTLGAEWTPPDGFDPGYYKAVVLIGEEVVAEKAFTVK